MLSEPWDINRMETEHKQFIMNIFITYCNKINFPVPEKNLKGRVSFAFKEIM